MLKRVRPTLRTMHLYAALTLGLYLAIISFTGGVLVFRPALKSWLHPTWHHVEPIGERLPLDQLLATYTADHPDKKVMLMKLPQRPGQTLYLWAGPLDGSQRRIYIDPYRGNILTEHAYASTWINWMEYLHIALLGDAETGIKINACLGLASIVLLVTGLILWWPSRLAQLRARLRVKWGAGWPRLNWDLHHALGIWALLPLVAFCLTGAALAFPGPVKTTVQWLTGTSEQTQPVADSNDRAVQSPNVVETATGPESFASPGKATRPRQWTIGDLVAQAITRGVPGGKARVVMWPEMTSRPLHVFVHPPGDQVGQWWIDVAVDRATGKVLKVKRPTDSPAEGMMAMMLPLHTGTIGGLPLKIAWCLVGFTPAILLATGLAMWWKRTRRRR